MVWVTDLQQVLGIGRGLRVGGKEIFAQGEGMGPGAPSSNARSPGTAANPTPPTDNLCTDDLSVSMLAKRTPGKSVQGGGRGRIVRWLPTKNKSRTT